jgi:hypothetical protein
MITSSLERKPEKKEEKINEKLEEKIVSKETKKETKKESIKESISSSSERKERMEETGKHIIHPLLSPTKSTRLTMGSRVIILGTDNVEQRVPQYVGMEATIVVVPGEEIHGFLFLSLLISENYLLLMLTAL